MTTEDNLTELRAIALLISSQPLKTRNLLTKELNGTEVSLSGVLAILPGMEIEKTYESSLLKLKGWQSSGLNIISFFEEDYPAALRNIEDPPYLLFSRGERFCSIQSENCLAIVGSRRADPEGLELASHFAFELAKRGITIVSGLALGIDGAAHSGALKADSGFSTIAVLGSGIDVIYPPKHNYLYKNIISSNRGVVISQFEPEFPPYPANFLNRNRIVSGLSKAVLVIQATLKSGSLVTAKNALEQGKDVFVIPGDIHNPRYEGSNKIIQQGATLVTCIEDLIEGLGLKNYQKEEPQNILSKLNSKIEKSIVEAVAEKGEIRVDELLRQLASSTIERELLMLELQGIIKRLPGNILKLK